MIIIGAGGHAKVICSIIEVSNEEVEAIYDDNNSIVDLNNYKVIGPYNPNAFIGKKLIIAIGNNQIRKKVANYVLHSFGKLIHPSVIIDKTAQVGVGSVLLHGSIIQRDVEIGCQTIINTNASIDHDCKIGDYVHISPGAVLCGNVTVGEGSQVSANATILPGINIGKWSIIGAGSVITKDVPDNSLVIGIPGKIKNK